MDDQHLGRLELSDFLKDNSEHLQMNNKIQNFREEGKGRLQHSNLETFFDYFLYLMTKSNF